MRRSPPYPIRNRVHPDSARGTEAPFCLPSQPAKLLDVDSRAWVRFLQIERVRVQLSIAISTAWMKL